jgi:hypothetical protein
MLLIADPARAQLQGDRHAIDLARDLVEAIGGKNDGLQPVLSTSKSLPIPARVSKGAEPSFVAISNDLG